MRVLSVLILLVVLLPAIACKKKAPVAPTPPAKAETPPAKTPTKGPCAGKPEKKVGPGTAEGTFAGVQRIGKRFRVFVRSKRRLLAFQVPKAVHGYFFIAHRGPTLSLGFEAFDACLPQLGDYRRVKRLVSVASGSLTSAQWWRRLQTKPGAAAAARKAFTDYVEGPFRK